jgi:hypothetical protein
MLDESKIRFFSLLQKCWPKKESLYRVLLPNHKMTWKDRWNSPGQYGKDLFVSKEYRNRKSRPRSWLSIE